MPSFFSSSNELHRLKSNENELATLERLYARREAVDDLIRTLEEYQRFANIRRGQCMPFNGGRKSW